MGGKGHFIIEINIDGIAETLLGIFARHNHLFIGNDDLGSAIPSSGEHLQLEEAGEWFRTSAFIFI